MYYCDDCRKKNDWPDSLNKSFGKCEVCGEQRFCHDVPSSCLPSSKGEACVEEQPLVHVDLKGRLTVEGFRIKHQE